MIFGGLGFNLFNPALVGRAVVLLSWLGVMSRVKPYPGGWFDALRCRPRASTTRSRAPRGSRSPSADRAADGAYGFDLAAQYGPLLFMQPGGLARRGLRRRCSSSAGSC